MCLCGYITTVFVLFYRDVNFGDNRYFTVNNLMSIVINCRKLQQLQVTKLTAAVAFEEKSVIQKTLQDEDVKFIINHVSPELHTLVLDTSSLTLPTFEVNKQLNLFDFYFVFLFDF